jgi:hypothetical protein
MFSNGPKRICSDDRAVPDGKPQEQLDAVLKLLERLQIDPLAADPISARVKLAKARWAGTNAAAILDGALRTVVMGTIGAALRAGVRHPRLFSTHRYPSDAFRMMATRLEDGSIVQLVCIRPGDLLPGDAFDLAPQDCYLDGGLPLIILGHPDRDVLTGRPIAREWYDRISAIALTKARRAEQRAEADRQQTLRDARLREDRWKWEQNPDGQRAALERRLQELEQRAES